MPVHHRTAYVQRMFKELLSREGVVAWDSMKIFDWYLTQRQ